MNRMQRSSSTPPTSSSSKNDFFAFDEEDTASFNFHSEGSEYLKSISKL